MARWKSPGLEVFEMAMPPHFEHLLIFVQKAPWNDRTRSQSCSGWDSYTAPTGAAPTITTFIASSPTVVAGAPVTLTWTTANDSYDFIDKLGGVRGGSVTIAPVATTTYTLNATNQYGRTTKQVTVVVQ
jgi:hypothetical protein